MTMADNDATTEETPITFTIKSSTDAKFTLSLPLSTLVSKLKEKLASSDYADTPAERQRLIYSGRVMKDSDTLEAYKIKDGHTIHLVKSAASNQQHSATGAPSNPAASGPNNPATTQPAAAAGVPTNLAAGTGNNPLAGLTGARYAGFAQLPGAGLFGPDGGMGPPPDSEAMLSMLENPQIQSQINEALQNPAMIDLMIQQNPMLRDMGPMARELMQRPAFRQMLTDPASIRQMMQMQRAMGMGGGGGLGGGESAFPAPGVTNTTEGTQNNQQQNTPPNPFGQMPNPMMGGNPFAALFGGQGLRQPPTTGENPSETATGNRGDSAQSTTSASGTSDPAAGSAQNPFASLLNPALFGNAGQGGINPFDPQQNPFLRDPALMSQMMQGMGGQGAGEGAAGANPLAALLQGGAGFGTSQPPDNRPPEERYADQLRQLNDMGFFEFERNIEALRRSGGSVQGAVEYLLSNHS